MSTADQFSVQLKDCVTALRDSIRKAAVLAWLAGVQRLGKEREKVSEEEGQLHS